MSAESGEILAIAIFECAEDKDAETLEVLRGLYGLMQRKGYGRDSLYRDAKNPHRYVNFRYWSSEEARKQAHEDPDVHKFWAKLGHLITMQMVFEKLEAIEQLGN